MAEIFNSKYNYGVEVYTSNAIDFKALRDPKGRIIKKTEKKYNKVNNLKINRFPIDYEITLKEMVTKIKNIEVYKSLNLSDDSLEKILKNGPYLAELIEHIIKSASSFKYDLIHTTFFPYFNLIISLIIGKLMEIPVVLTPFFHFSNPRYLDPHLLDILKKFDMLIACTNLEKDFLTKNLNISEEKIRVIPMGVDYKRFNDIVKKNSNDYSFKEKYFRNQEKKFKMVLYCGYKNYEKGSISILKAIPYILKEINEVYFVFIGPSTMAYNREVSKIHKCEDVRIINLTPENLTGYFDKKKIAAFNETDIFLMPSRTDAFGIAFLEAWALGKPVIGANVGATPEVINDNKDGFLVEFNNPQDIALKVITLLKKKRLRKKFGLAGKLKVVQKYNWDIVAEKTHRTYQNLIKNIVSEKI